MRIRISSPVVRRLRIVATAAGIALVGVRCASTRSLPAGTASDATAAALPMDVRIDTRLELLAIIFRLAGADEFMNDRTTPYARAVDSHFAAFRDHRAVAMVRSLRERSGVSHDAVKSLAVHLAPLPGLEPRVRFEGSQLERRWTAEDASAFAALAKDFATVSGAERFFASQQHLFDAVTARMRTLVEPQLDRRWFSEFFGPDPRPTRFILSIAMLNGQFAYGVRFVAPGRAKEAYAIMNVTTVDSGGIPFFSPSILPVIIHEYAHSFINPLVEAQLAGVVVAADSIRAIFSAEMQRQGYAESRTVVSESLVRTAVARYRLDHEGADSARDELTEQQLTNQFIWINDLYALLGSYAHGRDTYPDFASFLPVVWAYYRDLAPRARAAKLQFERELDPRRPRVVSTSPANDAQGVDPSLQTIAITFDRPMRASYATMLAGPDGKAHFPETVRVGWDPSRTVFRMTVRLRPSWSYAFALNHENVTGFASEDRVSLKPLTLRFTTGPERAR